VLAAGQVPDELDNVPMVDEALASAAYTSTSGGARTPSRKTRWTTEQIEALIEGVEKYGLSAWRTIVMVSWGGQAGLSPASQHEQRRAHCRPCHKGFSAPLLCRGLHEWTFDWLSLTGC
jgi:hypothetical protein